MLEDLISRAGDPWFLMIASLLTGAVIGLEREFKAKAAGVRTHALVCFSSTILMMAAVRQVDWAFVGIPGSNVVSDPTRMAHGILTGIGFLGAGVIFQKGNAVKGLTTAASIWMTAALGVLYGAGLVALALTGTVVALVVLIVFRLFRVLVPDRIERCVLLMGGSDLSPAAVTEALRRHATEVGPVAWKRSLGADGTTHVRVTVWLRRAEDAQAVDAALRQIAGLRAIAIARPQETDIMEL